MRHCSRLFVLSLLLLLCTGAVNAHAITIYHYGYHSTNYTLADPTITTTRVASYGGQTGMDAIYFDEHAGSGGYATSHFVDLFNSGVDMVFAQPSFNSLQESIINSILGVSLNYDVNHGGSWGGAGNLQASTGQAGHSILTGVNLDNLNEYYYGISGLPGGTVEVAESKVNGATGIFSYETSTSRMVVLAFEPMESTPNADERQLTANALNWAAAAAPVPEPGTFVLLVLGLAGLSFTRRKR